MPVIARWSRETNQWFEMGRLYLTWIANELVHGTRTNANLAKHAAQARHQPLPT